MRWHLTVRNTHVQHSSDKKKENSPHPAHTHHKKDSKHTAAQTAKLGADFWGRGSDEALFSEEKGLFSEKGGGIQ